MKRLVAIAGCALGLLALDVVAACPTTGGDEGEGEARTATPDELVDAFNTYLDRCTAEVFGAFATQEPTLVAILEQELTAKLAADATTSLGGPHISFDAAAAATCIGQLNAAACGAFTALTTSAPACATVARGTRTAGDICAQSAECSNGLSCFGSDSSTCGTCTARAGDGADCSSADCETGFLCSNGACTSSGPLTEGDPCTGNCGDSGLSCEQSVCTAVIVVPVNGTCNNTVRYCVDKSTKNFCDPTTSTCKARPGLGGDCSSVPLCDATVAQCDANSQTCVAAFREGDACTGECVAGESCENGTCALNSTPNVLPTCP